MNPEYLKAIAGTFTGFGAWFANSVAQIAAPDDSWTRWLDKYGLPTVMLAIALYVITVLYKAVRDSDKARITDKETTLNQYRSDFSAAQEARQALVDETRETKEALREFTQEMKTRPCGIRNDSRKA